MRELDAEPACEPPIVLADVLAEWNKADTRGRRELPGALFDELDVRGGRIVGYKPRHDHAAEVVALNGTSISTGAPTDGVVQQWTRGDSNP